MANNYRYPERNLMQNMVIVYAGFDSETGGAATLIPFGTGYSVTKTGTGTFSITFDNFSVGYSPQSANQYVFYAAGYMTPFIFSPGIVNVKVSTSSLSSMIVTTIDQTTGMPVDVSGSDIGVKAIILYNRPQQEIT